MKLKIYNQTKRITFLLTLLAVVFSCTDDGFEEFKAPQGNINGIEPNTLFTSANTVGDLGVNFRSFSTDAKTYLWDFGNGVTSTEANPNYVYPVGGDYEVVLETVSSDGLTASATENVTVFTSDLDFDLVDNEFTINSLGGVESAFWDFGDGTTSEDLITSNIYTNIGDYTITLIAVLTDGREITVTRDISVTNLPSVPDFSFARNGLDISFTNESTLAINDYLWDFGDGNTSTLENPTNTYASEGSFSVTLTTKNSVGVPRSITKIVPVGGIDPSFQVVVLNSGGDDLTLKTGDNADAFDMTPPGTIYDAPDTTDSPYEWSNSDLDSWLDADDSGCGGDGSEQPSSTSDGNVFAAGGPTRGYKLNEPCRRLYQPVDVEVGVEYTFTIDTRSEASGINTEVFILNNAITGEDAINTVAARDVNTDAYFEITNDFNSSKPTVTSDTFTTSTFTFTPTVQTIIIYVRALDAIDGSNEVFIDNIDIITPGF